MIYNDKQPSIIPTMSQSVTYMLIPAPVFVPNQSYQFTNYTDSYNHKLDNCYRLQRYLSQFYYFVLLTWAWSGSHVTCQNGSLSGADSSGK